MEEYNLLTVNKIGKNFSTRYTATVLYIDHISIIHLEFHIYIEEYSSYSIWQHTSLPEGISQVEIV